MKKFLLPLLLICTMQTAAQKSSIKSVTVEPYKTLSFGAFFKGLSIKSEPYSEYIEGFNFEWGYTYTLKIKETELRNPPADGSSSNYQLIKVLSKKKVADDYTFIMHLHYELYLGNSAGEVTSPFQLIEPGLYRYFDEINIEVPQEFEADFAAVLNAEKNKEAQFIIVSPNRIRMVSIK
ncbi:MAG: hypothetical protein ACJAU0_002066 [Flavobacteriales bacterium]|jgi:hypothetical protein